VYRVEASDDLTDWSETVFDSSLDPIPPIQSGRIEIIDPEPLDAGAPRFLRLRVIQQ
jgi:hypothetical protein